MNERAVTLIDGDTHLKGHLVLAHQPKMAKPPGGLKPLPTNLYDHPVRDALPTRGLQDGGEPNVLEPKELRS